MKIAFNANQTEKSQAVLTQLTLLCEQNQLDIDCNNPDIVVSIGGDGTMLSTFQLYKHQLDKVSFVAIHTGSLGFYTDLIKNELDKLIAFIKKNDKQTYSYPLLSIMCKDGERRIDETALNEVMLKTVSGTLVCDIYINDRLFEVFRGDGICIATPTGSTGVSKSLGGSVLHPNVEAMQLVEIAPLNNRVYRTAGSSLILPKEHCVKLVIKKARSPYLSIDNLAPIFLEEETCAVLKVELSTQRIQFAAINPVDFWDRVEEAFIGDVEKRRTVDEYMKKARKTLADYANQTKDFYWMSSNGLMQMQSDYSENDPVTKQQIASRTSDLTDKHSNVLNDTLIEKTSNPLTVDLTDKQTSQATVYKQATSARDTLINKQKHLANADRLDKQNEANDGI